MDENHRIDRVCSLDIWSGLFTDAEDFIALFRLLKVNFVLGGSKIFYLLLERLCLCYCIIGEKNYYNSLMLLIFYNGDLDSFL